LWFGWLLRCPVLFVNCAASSMSLGFYIALADLPFLSLSLSLVPRTHSAHTHYRMVIQGLFPNRRGNRQICFTWNLKTIRIIHMRPSY
jgi:hypothetical protein